MASKKIGAIIAVNRKKKGLLQEQLGERLGVTNKTISRWENGNHMSPIFEGWTMVSFPIPSKDVDKDNIRYDELFYDGICTKTILIVLGYQE